MTPDTLEIIKTIGSVLLGVLSVGGIGGGYFVYKQNKPKVIAESKKIEADAIVTFADGWQKYAINLETRLDTLNKLIEAKDAAHAKVVIQKDQRIDELEERIDVLEEELKKYKGLDVKIDDAKKVIHESVDANLENVKHHDKQ